MQTFKDETTQIPRIIKIIVDSEFSKNELLEASEYIHDINIDTDYMIINAIAHLYHNPDLIEVDTKHNVLEDCLTIIAKTGMWEGGSISAFNEICKKYNLQFDYTTLAERDDTE